MHFVSSIVSITLTTIIHTQTNSVKRNHQMMFFAQSVVGHIFQPSTNLDMIWSPFEMNEFHTAEMRLQKEPFSIGQVSCLAAIRVAEGGGGVLVMDLCHKCHQTSRNTNKDVLRSRCMPQFSYHTVPKATIFCQRHRISNLMTVLKIL